MKNRTCSFLFFHTSAMSIFPFLSRQENSMLIEQGEETVMLLKKAKCDYEQLKEKHDADIRESARNFKDEINQYVVLFVKLFLMIFFGMKNFS